jgi:NAD(P)-dependent dehydrogenase (short-subunit alcohol dehydrogenase family)
VPGPGTPATHPNGWVPPVVARGYLRVMTSYSSEELEAIQSVVDRVTSWQDGATESTVATELRSGFDEAGIDLPESEIDKLADAIQDEHGSIDAVAVLG